MDVTDPAPPPGFALGQVAFFGIPGAVNATKNTRMGTWDGCMHKFNPTKASYVKGNMLKSSANPAVHIVELRVFEVEK